MSRANVLLQAENFQAVSEEEVTKETKEKSQNEDGVYVKGMALPFGVPSRNGVQYEKESVKEAHEDLVGRTMLFNHKQDWVTGHILNTEITEDGMYFEGDINPNAEMPNGVPVAEAIQRGDINSVSIQAFIEQLEEEADEDAVIEDMPTEKVAVKDFLEISAVSIPGFPDAEAVPEHLQQQGVKAVTEMVGSENLTQRNESLEDPQYEEGDFVEWEFGDGSSQGEVVDRKSEVGDSMSAGGNEFTIEEGDSPLYKIEEWDETAGDNGEFTNNVVKFEDALSSADRPSAAEKSIDRENPLDREDTNTEETFDDYPEAAQENARMALEAKEDTGNPNDCGTQVGWERANQLDNGENLSEDTIGRMAAFSRHEDNKDQGEEGRADCGWMMWNAWGGDEGIEWAEEKMDEIDEEDLSEEVQKMLEDDNMADNQEENETGETETKQTENLPEMMDSVMDTIDGHNEELKSDLREMMEAMMDEEKTDDEEDEDEDEEESEQETETDESQESDDQKDREELKDKIDSQSEKIDELEERLEKLVTEDSGSSNQESPSSNGSESGYSGRPSFKNTIK